MAVASCDESDASAALFWEACSFIVMLKPLNQGESRFKCNECIGQMSPQFNMNSHVMLD